MLISQIKEELWILMSEKRGLLYNHNTVINSLTASYMIVHDLGPVVFVEELLDFFHEGVLFSGKLEVHDSFLLSFRPDLRERISVSFLRRMIFSPVSTRRV